MSDKRPREDNWLTHLRNLLGGRYYDTLVEIYNTLWDGATGFGPRIQKLEIFMNNNKEQEQRLLRAAETVENIKSSFEAFAEGMKSKVAALTIQAQSSTPAQNPVSLDEEFAVLEGVLGNLQGFANGLRSDAKAETDVPNPAIVNNPNTDVAFKPQVPAVEQHDPIPLAGQSGATNVPTTGDGETIEVGAGQVYAGQAQPGTGQTTSSQDVTSNPSASEIAQQETEQSNLEQQAAETGFEEATDEDDDEDFGAEDFASGQSNANVASQINTPAENFSTATYPAENPTPVGQPIGDFANTGEPPQPGETTGPLGNDVTPISGQGEVVNQGQATTPGVTPIGETPAPPIVDETITSGGSNDENNF